MQWLCFQFLLTWKPITYCGMKGWKTRLSGGNYRMLAPWAC